MPCNFIALAFPCSEEAWRKRCWLGSPLWYEWERHRIFDSFYTRRKGTTPVTHAALGLPLCDYPFNPNVCKIYLISEDSQAIFGVLSDGSVICYS